MIAITMVLLVGDLVYRAVVKPQDFFDLFIVIGGVGVCALVLFPKAEKNLLRLLMGVVLGAVLGLSGIILYDYVVGNPLKWEKYLSVLLGFLVGAVLVWILARVTRRGKS